MKKMYNINMTEREKGDMTIGELKQRLKPHLTSLDERRSAIAREIEVLLNDIAVPENTNRDDFEMSFPEANKILRRIARISRYTR